MNRSGPLAAVAAAVVFLAPVIAEAAITVDLAEVADALQERPVYVDADAERTLGENEVDALVEQIRAAGTPIYVAVLPAAAADQAGGDPDEVASELAGTLERPGTYAVLVGNSLRAGSTELPAGEAASLAR